MSATRAATIEHPVSVCASNAAMALRATLRRFQIELANVDAEVYASLDLRVAQHPSEELDRLVLRVLARCLLHEEGLDFGRGLSNVEEPALQVQTPDGRCALWVDLGLPAPERLHRASKHAERVVVATDRNDETLRRKFSGAKIHAADKIEVFQIPGDAIRQLSEHVSRDHKWGLTVSGGSVYCDLGGNELTVSPTTRPLTTFINPQDT